MRKIRTSGLMSGTWKRRMFLRQAPDFRAETEQQFVRGSTERSDGIPIFVKVWYINDIPAIIDLTRFESRSSIGRLQARFFPEPQCWCRCSRQLDRFTELLRNFGVGGGCGSGVGDKGEAEAVGEIS